MDDKYSQAIENLTTRVDKLEGFLDKGIELTIPEYAEKYGVKLSTVYYRISVGFYKTIEMFGKTIIVQEHPGDIKR